MCFCKSNYAGDPISRRNASGFMLYVLGVPVSWQSKVKRSMTLFSSKAEWVALLEAVKKIMFVIQLPRCMKISIKIPVMVELTM